MKPLSLCLVVISFMQLISCKKQMYTVAPDASSKNIAVAAVEKSTCPAIDPLNFGSAITNANFPLMPGTVFHYLNRIIEGADTTFEQTEVSVLSETKIIAGVECRAVHDVVTVNGEVTEDTYDWYAQDNTGTVWYFGEHTKSIKDKNGSTTEGSWKAGEHNACPGVIMWADPQSHKGEIYYQEFLSGIAEDQGQVISTNSTVTVPYGTFNHCLKTEEFTQLEPGVIEFKYYAANVGLLKTEMTSGGNELEVLTSVTHQ